MSKIQENTAMPRKNTAAMTTKTLTYCALLAALQVVLARLIIPMPNEFTRFSIEAVPTVLAGILFGPIAGGLVGFVSDLVGCLFSGYGYNPIFCVPPILYGLFAGFCRPMLAKKVSFLRLLLTVAPAVLLGSVLYQSWALGMVSGKGFMFFFLTRSVQFAITMVVDVVILNVLFKAKIFHRIGVWPPQKQVESEEGKNKKGAAFFRVFSIILGIVLIVSQIMAIAGVKKGGGDISGGIGFMIGFYAPGLLGIIALAIAFKEKRNDP